MDKLQFLVLINGSDSSHRRLHTDLRPCAPPPKYFSGGSGSFAQKCFFPYGDVDPHLTHGSLFSHQTAPRTQVSFRHAFEWQILCYFVIIHSGRSRVCPGCPPALLFRCHFLKRTYFENLSLRFLTEQGAS